MLSAASTTQRITHLVVHNLYGRRSKLAPMIKVLNAQCKKGWDAFFSHRFKFMRLSIVLYKLLSVLRYDVYSETLKYDVYSET